MSKKFARSSLCALGMTIMTAQAAEPPKAIGDGEGRLDIIAWPGYIERGQTDKNYDWVTQFEKETGCAVNVKTAATSDEMVSLMAKGGYDLVTASGDASLRLIMGKRVQPINPDLIPNWKTLDERIVKGEWFNVGGKVYGTPYQWGPNLLMYNTKTFPTPPDSWSVVFTKQDLPDGKPIRDACRPMTARFISPMRRCSSKRPSRSWVSKTLTSSPKHSMPPC